MDLWELYRRWVVVDRVAHRPDPANTVAAMCGQRYASTDPITRQPPRKIRTCSDCAGRVRAARQTAVIATSPGIAADGAPTSRSDARSSTAPTPSSGEGANDLRAVLRAERGRRAKRQQAEDLDRRSRTTDRSVSVRTTSGGLPGLGKRDH